MNKRKQSGFSLVELLIALAIFAVVSAASYVGLSSAIQSYGYFSEKTEMQTNAEVFVALITRDFLQVTSRIIRDANGDYQPAFKLGGSFLVEFSRSGLPTFGQGSSVSRVAYKLEKEEIWRYSWPYLDNIRTTEPSKSLLLKNVKKVSIVAIDESLKDHNSWPNSRGFNPKLFAKVPQAVEIEVELDQQGSFKRFIPGVSSVYVAENESTQQSQSVSVGNDVSADANSN